MSDATKHAWIIPLSIAVAAGSLAFAVSREFQVRSKASLPDCLDDVAKLTRTLRLTPEQVESVKVLHAAYSARLAQCCSTHCEARRTLAVALATEDHGGVPAEEHLGALSRAYEESELAALDHLRAVRAVLNSEQKEKFDNGLQACRCRSCLAQGFATRTTKEEQP